MRLIDQSPDEILLKFIEGLPPTVRDVILARCCMAFGRLDASPNQNLFGTFRSILMPEGQSQAYVCAKMAAVVELALYECDSGSGAALANELLERTGSHRFVSIDLQAWVAEKHWRAARDAFLELRREALHSESLSRMLVQARDRRERGQRIPGG